ncbi:TraR/DksA family transcriptional regulator [Noviherbaspirillum sp.]|uniref:TraR/DksA family transcriptional regulator n=1 Tax=Noviherbaspirillum sp. TaxID=1926288 RepID=UPI002B47C766|nr:TraR/DksA family transcriptional regulator [Noviherbaspirillum sp.]HJV79894.1 TraR/DksA family transcriptional regulator [Noviherbaspirillum sp.]
MSKDFIEQQRKRLEALRAQLLGGEAKALANLRRLQEERGEEAREFEDRAQDMEQNEVYQALHDVDKQRLNRIDRALQKIAEGTYGISDVSGEPIPKARLDEVPEALVAVQDETREEGE